MEAKPLPDGLAGAGVSCSVTLDLALSSSLNGVTGAVACPRSVTGDCSSFSVKACAAVGVCLCLSRSTASVCWLAVDMALSAAESDIASLGMSCGLRSSDTASVPGALSVTDETECSNGVSVLCC